MAAEPPSEWVAYFADRHGRPSEGANEHLTDEQRDELNRRGEALGRARGRHQAVVVVDVYENGEAVPQVQFPAGSSLDMTDPAQVNELVTKAAEALNNWR